MKFRVILFSLLMMGLACATWGAWVEVNSPIANRVPAVEVRSLSESTWQMDVSIPGLAHETFMVDGQTYDFLSLPGEMMANQEGEAALPFISRMIALRTSGNPEIEIISEEWIELDEGYSLALDMEGAQAEELASVYEQRDEYLPVEAFGVTPRQVMGGVSLAVVHIQAARYNPALGKVQVLRSAEIRIHETGSAVNYDRSITETTAGILKAVVPNWDEMGLDNMIVRGTLLYIYGNSSILDNIDDLVTWRERKGHTVELAGPGDIGDWSTFGIKGHIQSVYNSADPPLEFVCLLGDEDGSFAVPTYDVSGGPGDWNYSRLDGTDVLPDVHIGRWCFDTEGSLRVIVSKIYGYERNPAAPQVGGNPSWYKGGGIFAGSGSGISPIMTSRWVRERMLEADYTSAYIDTVYYTNESVTGNKMRDNINAGISLYTYRGYLRMEDFDDIHIAGLNNDWRLPFMITITCGTNDFDSDYTYASVCEALLKAGTESDPKGVIGAIGTSSMATHTRFNNCLLGGVVHGLLREGIHTMGGALSRSKVELNLNYPNDPSYVADFCHYESLIGDPAVDIFTDTPEQLYADNPGSVPIGTNSITLTITGESAQPIEGVYVNLLKGTEIFMGDWTDASGQVVFNCEMTTAETLFVTATKHNCRPAINHTLVQSTDNVAPPSLTFTIDDDTNGESQGDGDGLANPGETVEVEVPLKNWSGSTVNGVEAVLSLTDPYLIGIGDNTESYGDIGGGATADPGDDFDFTIADYAPDGYVLQFELTVTDGSRSTWISAVPITVANGNLEYFSHNLLNVGDGVLDPGESGQITFRLNNVGGRGTEAHTVAYLISSRSTIVSTDSAIFDASVVGGQSNNYSYPFNISASSSAFEGEVVPMSLVFPMANGFTDTIHFNLPIGSLSSSDPTPADEYGYWAFDNTDTGYDKHPTYNWVELDPRYGGSGATQLNINDYSDQDDATRVVNLPFTFQYYGQEFTQISVCSNGWIAMGADQVVQTGFRNWYIPGALGPEGMIAPFWDDLYRISYNGSYGRIYYKHDTANHRFIVEWSHTQKNASPYYEQTFECILYEPGYPATPTGDGEILFQYETITNCQDYYTSNHYATVGIENLDESDGVLYSYYNIAGQGAASMTAPRAILFTTQQFSPGEPKAPEKLTAIRSGDDIELRWEAVDEDIHGNPITVTSYSIYRDTTPDFTPGGGNYLGTAPSASYTDTGAALLGDKYFYVVQATNSTVVSPRGSSLSE